MVLLHLGLVAHCHVTSSVLCSLRPQSRRGKPNLEISLTFQMNFRLNLVQARNERRVGLLTQYDEREAGICNTNNPAEANCADEFLPGRCE